MKCQIDFNEPSTIRGLVWVIVGVVGLAMIALGDKDITSLITLGGAVVSGMIGFAVKDNG